jgi:hypothetical protein
VSYVDDIALPLVRVLEHNAGLSVHQLAGHMANVDFWLDEVRHCIAVIDGYAERFEKLRWAQAAYERGHPHAISDSAGWSKKVGREPLLKKSSPDSERRRLRRQLLKAAGRLIDRAHRDGLIDLSRADDLRERLPAEH